MISASSLRGYVLEELLAAELRNTGFTLLASQTQDPFALVAAANGLRVRGRGADHQVDVLGELNWEIPYSLPVRLFVEAKYRSEPVGISDVRNAVGIVNDVNEHYSSAGAKAAAPATCQRFHYRYSLFSASGFTGDAEEFAYAQQVSLIDLDTPSHRHLLEASTRATERLHAVAVGSGLPQFPVNQMREAFRRALQTWPSNGHVDESEQNETDDFSVAYNRAAESSPSATAGGDVLIEELAQVASELVEAVDESLCFGVTNSPFLVAARLEQPDEHQQWSRAKPSVDESQLWRPQQAELSFAGRSGSTDEWALVTSDREVVRFSLMPSLEEAILAADTSTRRQGSRTRTLTLMDRLGGTPLRFSALDVAAREAQRATRYASSFGYLDDDIDDRDLDFTPWSQQAMDLLLQRLRDEERPQAAVIIEAALLGGLVTRESVYMLAQFPPSRTLRGFTRPPRRIAAGLVSEGMLDGGAAPPLIAVYQKGVLATHFQVPREFVDYLAQ